MNNPRASMLKAFESYLAVRKAGGRSKTKLQAVITETRRWYQDEHGIAPEETPDQAAQHERVIEAAMARRGHAMKTISAGEAGK